RHLCVFLIYLTLLPVQQKRVSRNLTCQQQNNDRILSIVSHVWFSFSKMQYRPSNCQASGKRRSRSCMRPWSSVCQTTIVLLPRIFPVLFTAVRTTGATYEASF